MAHRISKKECNPNNNKIVLYLYLLLGINIVINAQNWQLIQPVYTTSDAFVAGYSVKDYGASGDGVTDVTSVFQSQIDSLATSGGGTLFVPGGKYVFKGTLILRKGVILRGEWQKPIKGQAIAGTILMTYAGRGNENNTSFITMEPSSAIQDMVIWYPEQNPENVAIYPPTILFGEQNYFGNDYCSAKNITLVNSYAGIAESRLNMGSCPIINGIYGTPLSRGIEIDNIADVGRIENIHFSPNYWEGSGLPGAPAIGGSIEKWILSNGTGIVMRRNDWSYTCFVAIDGYKIGMHVGPSIASPGSGANGHYYSLAFTGCGTGIYFETTSDVGIMFAKINIDKCNNGITIGPRVKFPIQLHTCEINASQNALTTDEGSTVKLLMQKCTLNGGQVLISGGTITASDCDFNDPIHKIVIGSNARAVLTGNRFTDVMLLQNNSLYTSYIGSAPITIPDLPDYSDTLPRNQKPLRMILYNVLAAPFNAKNDGIMDNTTAIQSALNAAFADGGGIVFLPPGKYKVLGTLTVPTGVELKGAVDIGTAPMGPGSILEIYSGKGNESGTPFISLSQGSGLRGVVFDYPEQLGDNVPNFYAYPYCIQVTGNDVYIVNVGIRAAYNGIDLFTNKCDNHYLDYVAGQVLKTGIKVGGNSAGGKISNVQFNPIGYVYGYESKWGGWSNAPSPANLNNVVNYVKNNLLFMVLENCSNETLYNDFHYASQSGLVINGASGISLGTGIDGSRKSLVISSIGASGFDFINSQIVAIDNLPGTCYIEANSGFTTQTNFFNSDYWGWTEYGISQAGGNLNFQLANFQYPGNTAFANITGGNMSIINSAIMPVNLLLNSGQESHFSAESSVLDPSGINMANCILWNNNLSNSPEINSGSSINRTGWTATASLNNVNAWRGIDGDASTRWDTGIPQSAGQWYSVDMKSNNTFNKIILDDSQSPYDYPIGYSVYVSTDGTNWGSPVKSGSASSAIAVINFPTQFARYIKIIQTGSSDTWWWSINEFYVLNSATTEPVTAIRVFPTSLNLILSSGSQLTDTISPNDASNIAISWSSSNTGVATVNSSGMVSPVSIGKALITVTALDGGETATSLVTVYEPVSTISLLPASLDLKVDSIIQLMPTILPVNATFNFVTWNSSNWAVATVSPNGLVTGVDTGMATITVKTSDGNKTATTILYVINNTTGISEINGEKMTFRIIPNPVHGDAFFEYSVEKETDVTISIYSVNGALIKSEDQSLLTGQHIISMNLDKLNAGIYFVRFSTNEYTVTTKLIVR